MTSCLCKSEFAGVAVIKTKYCLMIAMEQNLKVVGSSLIPRSETLCSAQKEYISSHKILWLFKNEIKIFCFYFMYINLSLGKLFHCNWMAYFLTEGHHEEKNLDTLRTVWAEKVWEPLVYNRSAVPKNTDPRNNDPRCQNCFVLFISRENILAHFCYFSSRPRGIS